MSSLITGQDVLQAFSASGNVRFSVDPTGPHQLTWGGSSMVSSQLRGCSLHGLWQVTLSVSAPPPSVKQRRARILQESLGAFLLAFIKHFAIIKKKGIEKSELLSLPLNSQVSAKLCCCGHDNLHMVFGWYRQVQSPAWVLAWLRSCLAFLLLQGHTTLGTGLVS